MYISYSDEIVKEAEMKDIIEQLAVIKASFKKQANEHFQFSEIVKTVMIRLNDNTYCKQSKRKYYSKSFNCLQRY